MRQAPSVLQGRGGTSFLWGVWHQDEALWHGPMPYEGGDGQRLLWRRRLRSLCSALEWCSQADGLIEPGPLLQVSARGSTWRRCVPPIPECEGSHKPCPPVQKVEGGQTFVVGDQIWAEHDHCSWGGIVSSRPYGSTSALQHYGGTACRTI